MASLREIVWQEVQKQPILLEALRQRLANVSAVAGSLQASVQKQTGTKVTVEAVGMALRRLLSEETSRPKQEWKVPKHIEITSRTQIYEVAVARSAQSRRTVDIAKRKLELASGDFLSVIEGSYEIVIFTNQKHKARIRKLISPCDITSELSNLAYVTVNWPRETKDIPGIYFRITGALAMKNVSIQSFHTVGAEMMIFVKEDVFQEALVVLTSFLQS